MKKNKKSKKKKKEGKKENKEKNYGKIQVTEKMNCEGKGRIKNN
jgi:hypothetical protein